jgi:hypothetical protein
LPSQGWRTFLRNHLLEPIAVDFAVVPTIRFKLLYAFVVLDLARIAVAERLLRETDRNNTPRVPRSCYRGQRAVADGRVMSLPQVGGLHHRYERLAA